VASGQLPYYYYYLYFFPSFYFIFTTEMATATAEGAEAELCEIVTTLLKSVSDNGGQLLVNNLMKAEDKTTVSYWIFSKALGYIKNFEALLRSHLEKSSADRLRAFQLIYTTFRDKKETIKAIVQYSNDESDIRGLRELCLEEFDRQVEDMRKQISDNINAESLAGVKESAELLSLFYEVAEFYGGDKVFLPPPPDPAVVARVAGVPSTEERKQDLRKAGYNIPQVCKEHPEKRVHPDLGPITFEDYFTMFGHVTLTVKVEHMKGWSQEELHRAIWKLLPLPGQEPAKRFSTVDREIY
jgi:hypothetical protein